MAKTYGNLPFSVNEDQYTNTVRIERDGYCQAIDVRTWYDAIAEPAMMNGLIENFMKNLDNSKRRYYKEATMSMNRHLAIGECPITNNPFTLKEQSPTKPKFNKLLLLCEEN